MVGGSCKHTDMNACISHDKLLLYGGMSYLVVVSCQHQTFSSQNGDPTRRLERHGSFINHTHIERITSDRRLILKKGAGKSVLLDNNSRILGKTRGRCANAGSGHDIAPLKQILQHFALAFRQFFFQIAHGSL